MEQHTGRIVRFLYKHDASDFAVALFRTVPTEEKPEEELKIKGNSLKRHATGKDLNISGVWETHAKHGAAFNVITANLFIPKDKRAITEYLGTYVRGVGVKTLRKIVEFFGEDTLEVIRTKPNRLNEVSGVSANIQKKIVSGCKREQIIKDIALKIDQYDVPVATAEKIYERFGDQAQQILDTNPYATIGVHGFGFKSADRMAQHGANFQADSIQRVAGRVKSYLYEQAKNGHTCAPVETVIKDAVDMCGVNEQIAQTALTHLITSGDLVHDFANTPSGRVDMIYLPKNHSDEVNVSRNINRVLYAPVEKPAPQEAVLHILAELEQLAQKSLTDEQKMGVERAFTAKISVLTGKPGTGKTTCTRAIVALAKRLNLKYGLCAPTGRAAKNMTAACGEKATTIHRLLEYKDEAKRKPGDSLFAKDEDHQLGFDVLLIDEASMVDTKLLRCLLEAVPNGCRIVLIGDDNQLPSVGAGRCLHDFIRSGVCPVTELNIIHRQAQESNIITNAHRILDGKKMVFPCQDIGYLPYSDCAFLETPMIENPDTEKQVEDPEWVRTTLRHLCSWYLPQYCGLDPIKDVQILTPRKAGACGVFELNQLLQHSLNPNGKVLRRTQEGLEFREGDRIMCIKNNYDLNIFNGDIGTAVGYDMAENALIFDFYGETVKVKESELQHLSLAYAATIHKSQGSEYKAVILLMLKQHGIMLQRNLLYTGITRAKQRLVVVGSKQAIAQATRNIKPVQRNTLLWHRLSRLRLTAAA
jgi:exodeoxyribonuclease V alpha subunit